jgi:hypothetical protein
VSYIPADLTQPEFHAMTIEENLRTLQLNLIAPVALSHHAEDHGAA